MARKAARALLILAVLLIGLKPTADLTVAAAASLLKPPCCADCDQPAMPDGTACGAVGACVAAPPFTPPLAWSAVGFDIALSRPLLSETGTALADTTPPFRPPRTFLIA